MQKQLANHWTAGEGYAAPGIDKGTYIIVAILIPFLAVGLAAEGGYCNGNNALASRERFHSATSGCCWYR